MSLNKDLQRRKAGHPKDSADDSIVNPRRLPSRASSEVCGQCHGITAVTDEAAWLQEGFAYRPGDRLERTRRHLIPGHEWGAAALKQAVAREPDFLANRYWSDGTVRVSGREWTGMVRSPCYQRGELSCLSCHSMHKSDPNDQLGRGKEGNQACVQCHKDFRQPERLTAHTHHAGNSEGSQCYNCHMPHTTYGVLKAIRSHRIESPSVAASLTTGRPNGCNLCHLDRSLGWTAEHLASWYGVKTPDLPREERDTAAGVLWLLRGDAGQRALAAWSMGWGPARQASGQDRDDWMNPYLVFSLADSYSAVRYVAQRSLRKSAVFADLAYDFAGSEEAISTAVDRAVEKGGRVRHPLPEEKASRLVMRPDGSLQTERVREIVSRRDNRSLDLKE